MFDAKAFGEEVVALVKGYVERTLDGFAARLEALEKALTAKPVTEAQIAEIIAAAAAKAAEMIPPSEPGHDGVGVAGAVINRDHHLVLTLSNGSTQDLGLVVGRDAQEIDDEALDARIAAAVERAIAGVPAPKDGQDVDQEALDARIDTAVARAVGALPKPRDGQDVDAAALDARIDAAVSKAVADLPSPEAAEPEALESLIKAAVEMAFAAVPKPKDGQDVDQEALDARIDAAVTKAVGALPAPKDGADGVGVAGALIDRENHLLLTLSNGETRDLGEVVGRDGLPGTGILCASIDDAGILKFELSDGTTSLAGPVVGRDGFSLEDFDTALLDDGRTVRLTFIKGDTTEMHDLHFPAVLYRGVFKDGTAYAPGDMVTWGGSTWHCDVETSEKPGEGVKAWTLAVKRGRDGKDATPGEAKGLPVLKASRAKGDQP